MQENKQEKSLIKQNILLYLSKKDVTPYEFYKKSGVTRGILQQNNGISEDNIARFLAYAPDVNVEWLILAMVICCALCKKINKKNRYIMIL